MLDLLLRELHKEIVRQSTPEYGERDFAMELAALIVVLLVAGALIPARHDVTFYRWPASESGTTHVPRSHQPAPQNKATTTSESICVFQSKQVLAKRFTARERGNYAALGERAPDFGSFLIMCTIDSGVRNLRPSPDFRDFASIETPCSLLRSTLVIDPPPSVP